MKTIVFVLFTFFATSAFAKHLKFKWNGEVKTKLSTKDFASGRIDINGVELRAFDRLLFNPWRGYKRTYRGYSFYELLDAVYGKRWRKAKSIAFVSWDGYRQKAKIHAMLKAAKGKSGHLSYTEAGKKGFTTFKRGKKIIDPSFFYLVWSGFRKGDRVDHGDTLKWPFQLKSLSINTK